MRQSGFDDGYGLVHNQDVATASNPRIRFEYVTWNGLDTTGQLASMAAMQRKFLFVVFAEDVCRQLHAFMYANDLHRKGYETKVIVEGMATRLFADLDKAPPRLQKAVAEAKASGVIAGVCLQASSGCGSPEDRNIVDAISGQGVGFLSDLDNHAGIEPFLKAGYEIITV